MTNRPLIDTHAHLSFPEFEGDLKNVFENARECNVVNIVNIASGKTPSHIKKSLEIASQQNFIFNTIGVHPSEVDYWDINTLKEIESLITQEKIVAVGETGLDFLRSSLNAQKQSETFKTLIKLAKLKNLPLIIHQRKAFDEVLTILKKEKVPDSIPFVFHCFGGTFEESIRIINMGGYISITGIITFKKVDNLRGTISKVPLDRIMLETDSPYLSPEPKRGKRNEPCNVIFIARKIAEIKKVSVEEIADATTLNARKFFRLSEKLKGQALFNI